MLQDDENQTRRIEQFAGLAALLLLLIGCFFVVRPFVSAFLWALVLCLTLWPIQSRLSTLLGGREALAAVVTTFTIASILVGPFLMIGFSLVDDARAIAVATRKWLEVGLPQPPDWVRDIPLVGGQVKSTWVEVSQEITDVVRKLKQGLEEARHPGVGAARPSPRPPSAEPQPDSRLVGLLKSLLIWARSSLLSLSLAIGQGVLEVALSVFLTFFVFQDGAALALRLKTGIRRIAGERGNHLLDIAVATVRGVVYGILGTALVQGIMAGFGFLIAGIPGAGLLGLLTFFLSPVPLGPVLLWLPATIWLVNQGFLGWAIFMFIWGVAISSMDNVVRPWLISQGNDMPFVLIFLGVAGGALAFGFIGVFLGPTLLAVSYRLIEEWSATSPALAAIRNATPTPPTPPADGQGQGQA